MQSLPVVNTLMYSKAVAVMSARVAKRQSCTRSFLKLLNHLWVGALSHALCAFDCIHFAIRSIGPRLSRRGSALRMWSVWMAPKRPRKLCIKVREGKVILLRHLLRYFKHTSIGIGFPTYCAGRVGAILWERHFNAQCRGRVKRIFVTGIT